MYAFSQDEKHLLFIDCFGLTRLSAPKKVKTDRKVSGSDSAGLATVSRNGDMAGSYEDIWDKSVLWNFPTLKSAKRFDRFREKQLIVHPEGTHYIVPDSGALRLEPAEANAVLLPTRLDGVVDPKGKGAATATASLEGGRELPDLELGGEGFPNTDVPLRISHDGTLLHMNGRQLACGTLSGTKVTMKWRRRLQVPERARVEAHADAERCVIAVHRGRTWTIVERVEASGKEQRFDIESLCAPALAGPYVAWQRDDATVVRRDLRTGEDSEHSVEVYDKKKRPTDAKNTGPGTIFAGAGGKLMFLCSHRESLVDLIKGVEISRKLPAKELEIRQALLAKASPYVNAARFVGVTIELGRVELEPKRGSVSVTHHISGPDSLLGALLASHSHSCWNDAKLPGGWRMGSYGSHGGINTAGTATAAELVAGYTQLAEAGVPFASTISFWSDKFESRWGNEPPSDVETLSLLGQVLLATVRDGVSAKLDFAALAKAGTPSLDEVIAGFAAYPTTGQALPYNTSKFVGGVYNRLFGAEAGKLWRALFCETDGFGGGSLYCDLDREAIRPLIEAHPEAAAPLREWFASNEVDENDPRRWALEQLREHLSGG